MIWSDHAHIPPITTTNIDIYNVCIIYMKKCICTDEWRWGTIDKQLLYAVAAIFFSLGMFIDTNINWDTIPNSTRLTLVSFNFIGFLLILIYQIRNKWMAGVIIVSVTTLISLVPLYRAIYNRHTRLQFPTNFSSVHAG